MKKLFLALLIIESTAFAEAGIGKYVGDIQVASSTNIPTAYTTAGGTCLSASLASGKTHVRYWNGTATDIYVCFNEVAAADCSSDVVVKAGSGFMKDAVRVAAIYHKSTGSAISSGTVDCGAW